MVLQVLVASLLAGMSVSCPDSLCVMFWNLENFFDAKDGGGGSSDRAFSAKGERHWTARRYRTKCDAVAKTIIWTGDRTGRAPDIVAVAEVENRKVLADLTRDTPLRKLDYAVVHYESPDRRGIDVGILYRKAVFRLARSVPLHISGVVTRDILLVSLIHQAGDTLHLLVNHHPSKFGGGATAWRREAAVARLRAACDSLWHAGGKSIILTGDFNDTPENSLFGALTDPPGEPDRISFVNLALPLSRRGQGSIRFQGKWELIDMFFVSPPLASRSRMEILSPPFLLVWDNVHPGYKPHRTYSGPRYIGGVSDHLPVLLHLALW